MDYKITNLFASKVFQKLIQTPNRDPHDSNGVYVIKVINQLRIPYNSVIALIMNDAMEVVTKILPDDVPTKRITYPRFWDLNSIDAGHYQ
jgi:hypothetical protein